MTVTISNWSESLRDPRRAFTWAKIWTITRADGTVHRFTSHDRPLRTSEGVFSPTPGASGFALRREAGLKALTTDLRGLVDSGGVSFSDRRGGRLDAATVVQKVIDWRRPWVDAILSDTFHIEEVQYDSYEWRAELSGYATYLSRKVGET